jgi:hypothetical protein
VWFHQITNVKGLVLGWHASFASLQFTRRSAAVPSQFARHLAEAVRKVAICVPLLPQTLLLKTPGKFLSLDSINVSPE